MEFARQLLVHALALAAFGICGSGLARGATDNIRSSGLPQDKIETTLQAKGSMKHGVLSIDLARGDIGTVKGPDGVNFSSDFGIHGEVIFQSLPNRRPKFHLADGVVSGGPGG